jgi:peptidoglycan/xylan/chitin deacetylase (PgdA/CDA1 family)
MSWSQIKKFLNLICSYGNHSHSHAYLVDQNDEEIKKDLQTSIKIFKEKLNHETNFFAYPFGEYKSSYKKIVQNLGFQYAFGQHSGYG